MSALNILGGIGQGVQKGVAFMQQKQMQDQQAAQAEERQGWLRDEFNQKQEEKGLNDWMAEQYRSIYSRNDLDDYGKAAEYTKTILPRARPEHIEVARKATDALYQQLGVKGVDALARGDISVLQRLADTKAPGTQILMKDGVISVNKPDGTAQTIDRNGLISMLELSKASETITARETADLDRRAKEAKIAADRALAGYRDRSPMARTGGVGGSRSAGNGAGKSGSDGFDPIGTLKDYSDAFKDQGLGEEGAAWDKALGFQLYSQLRDNNPELIGSEGGQARMLRISRDLAAARATAGAEDLTDEQRAALPRISPDIDENGQLALYAHIGPDMVRLERGLSEDRLMRTQGLDGKPLATTPEDVSKMYLQAMNSVAQREPTAYTAAITAVRDPKVMAELRAEAGAGNMGAVRALKLVPAIQRADVYARDLPPDKPAEKKKDSAPVFTEQERAATSGIKIQDVDRRGLWDRVTDAAGAVKESASRAMSAADENFVKAVRQKINSTRAVDQGDAIAVVQRLRDNPSLKGLFSEDELWAIQMAANQRI